MLTVFFLFFLAVTWGEYSLLLVSILYIILYYIEPFTGNWNFVFRQMTFIWSHCCAGCGGCGHHVNNHAPPPICDIYHTASVFVCVRESVCPTLCALARQLVLCSDGLQDCTHIRVVACGGMDSTQTSPVSRSEETCSAALVFKFQF